MRRLMSFVDMMTFERNRQVETGNSMLVSSFDAAVSKSETFMQYNG